MVLLSSSWSLDLAIVLAISTFLLWRYFVRNFDYWKRRGVYTPKPLPFFGNVAEVFFLRKTVPDWITSLCRATDEKYFGLFILDEPILVLKDPKLIQHVLVKDSSHFVDRSTAEPEDEMMANFMFLQKSPEWKIHRTKLTPVFSSGKLKALFHLVNDVGVVMVEYLSKHLGVIEAKDISAKYSTDVIAKCAFGIDAYSFEDDGAAFRKFSKAIFEVNLRNSIAQRAYFLTPKWAEALHMDFVDARTRDFFRESFSKTMKSRETSNVRVNDFVDLLLDLKKYDGVTGERADLRACGQGLMFFVAGFETTSGAISATLHELCVNKDIQTRVRKEIVGKIEEHGGITYEAVQDMKYLRMCVDESLRMYPVLPFLDRRCNENYKLPGTDLVIEKGMPVFIPVTSIQNDEKYFPNPEKYDPERFATKNQNAEGVVYMPFGKGPRNCVGARFGLISTQMALIHVLLNFEVERCPETQHPVEFDEKSLIVLPKNGLPMRLKKLSTDLSHSTNNTLF
ncbi:hypothetical protein JTB14_001762 [Gonioctena quinquepunctata]|nr:hypothetical protein JTB14_001762 [Gonioctena quinquepunctata]